MKKYSVIILLLLYHFFSFAQRIPICKSDEYRQFMVQNYPSVAVTYQQIESFLQNYSNQFYNGVNYELNGVNNFILTVPVVFHIVYNTTEQNIINQRIFSNLELTNKDLSLLNNDASTIPSAFAPLAANTKIQLCLAKTDPLGNPTSGIIRKSTTRTSFANYQDVKSETTGGSNPWPSDKYLNIWVCNLGPASYGYSSFPGEPAHLDGVVINYQTVGDFTNPFPFGGLGYGRTLTHEVGHWFNLFHTFQQQPGVLGSEDYVFDTPSQLNNSWCSTNCSPDGCRIFPFVDTYLDNNGQQQTLNAPNGRMFMNHMDYGLDVCKKMFTIGQVIRMQGTFAPGGPRASLRNSIGCIELTISGPDNFCNYGVFTFPSLPSGYNIIWTAAPSTILNLSPNTSNPFQVEVSAIASGSASLNATITGPQGFTKTISKSISFVATSYPATPAISASPSQCGVTYTASAIPAAIQYHWRYSYTVQHFCNGTNWTEVVTTDKYTTSPQFFKLNCISPNPSPDCYSSSVYNGIAVRVLTNCGYSAFSSINTTLGNSCMYYNSMCSGTEPPPQNRHNYERETAPEQQKEMFSIKIFPNPANTAITVTVRDTHKGPAKLTILNSLGVAVKRLTITSDRTLVLTSEIVSGVYLFRIQVNDRIYQEKVVITH